MTQTFAKCCFAGLLLLAAACSPLAAPTPTLPPVATLVPSLTPSTTPDVQELVNGTLTALALTTAPLPSATPSPVPSPSETPLVITLPAVTGNQVPPPFDITLPSGWGMAYDAQVLQDVDGAILAVPVAVYSGPITNGTGFIVVYWGFPNFIPPSEGEMLGMATSDPTSEAPDLWADGLRLLRLAIVEQGCNTGTDLKRSYRVGLLAAVGTQFAAVDCPELPDTRGWFAGVIEKGINFVFYAYADPISAMDTSSGELQAILDTVRFRVPEVTVTPAP